MELLGLAGILTLWGVLGVLPAWVALIPTRGRALVAMPLSFVAGLAGGALVALLGDDTFVGFWLSLLVAMIAGLAATLGLLATRPHRALSPDA